MNSALLEREIGESARALELLDEGIAKYPGFAKVKHSPRSLPDCLTHSFTH